MREKLLKGQHTKTLDKPLPRRAARSAPRAPDGATRRDRGPAVCPVPTLDRVMGAQTLPPAPRGAAAAGRGLVKPTRPRGAPLTGSQEDGASGRQLTWAIWGTTTSQKGNGVSGTEEEVPPFQGSDTAG